MTQYIDKSAVVAEINRVLNSYDPNEITSGRYALVSLRKFLDTLEVIEVDLEQEIHLWIEDNTCGGYCSANIRETAEYFFELGLKTQKGE